MAITLELPPEEEWERLLDELADTASPNAPLISD